MARFGLFPRQGWSSLVFLALLSQDPRAAQRARPANGPLKTVTFPNDQESFGTGTVLAHSKISNDFGGFPDSLDDFDRFGSGLANVGDLDGDGIPELAVGASGDVGRVTDPSAGPSRGAVWLLFFDASGQVRTQRKIEGEAGGSVGSFADEFGGAVAALGDLDGNGIGDLAIGARGDDDGGGDRGAAWVVLLEADGTEKARQKISDTAGGFTGTLRNLDLFGSSVAGLGDLDGDGVGDLAVGAPGDDGNGSNSGAIWVLFLHANGTVKGHQKITATLGGFTGTLDAGDAFGSALGGLGDLDGDGVGDLAVGASGDDGTFASEGSVWLLFLRPNGTVRAHQKISSLEGGFVGGLDFLDNFGSAVAVLGDVDGDGLVDLAVGSAGDQDGGTMSFDRRGAAHVLFLRSDGTVRAQQKISLTQGGFGGSLGPSEGFGTALAALGDFDGDGVNDLAVGAIGASSTQSATPGAVWMLSLAVDGTVASEYRIRDGEAGFPPSTLEDSSSLGHSMVALGDLDGDGVGDIAVGAAFPSLIADQSPTAVWVFFLTPEGTVKAYQKIGDGEGGLPAGTLSGFFDFGLALAPLGDFDGDGLVDLAVSALEVGGGGGTNSRLGTTFLLFLAADGTVKDHRTLRIPRAQLEEGDEVGTGLAALGDLDGDGVLDLIAGAPGDGDGPFSDNERGAVYVEFLNADGSLKAFQKISYTQGGFTGEPPPRARFGDAVAALGDVDGDGVVDVAVGAGFEDDGGTDRGAVYVLFLRTDGSVKGHTKISSTQGFPGLVNNARFGASVAGLGDLDGDGVRDLAVGGWGSSSDHVWVLFLNADGTVKGHVRIGNGEGGFTAVLDPFDFFGESVANLGDLDGDGVTDLGVGARGDDDGGAQHGAVWLLNLDGIACLDFSSADDTQRTPLVNGRALASPSGFARTIQLSSTGANLGPAIFDSTPLGPNDPSQDRDLLVGLGNVLVLQNSLAPTQSVPGIFDRPNDDQDGGTFTFAFPHGPVEALRLTLIDIDPGSNQMASVRLFDASNRTRTYSIPAGWTEDRITHGPPGYRTLDLTTLEPQPGFQASATATQAPGFDARAVTHLVATLGSSGALDDLCWDPHPDF